jgi:antitoxin VapB
METTKIFNSGNSQAVRLPKKYRFEEKEAYISKIGDAIVIFPKKSGWVALLESIDKFTDDIFDDRMQPEIQNRGNLFK